MCRSHVLVSHRAEIYHNASVQKTEGTTISRFRPTYLGINLTMYIVFAILYSIDLGFCFTTDLECDPTFPTFNTTFQVL